jgi:hypothetical protein
MAASYWSPWEKTRNGSLPWRGFALPIRPSGTLCTPARTAANRARTRIDRATEICAPYPARATGSQPVHGGAASDPSDVECRRVPDPSRRASSRKSSGNAGHSTWPHRRWSTTCTSMNSRSQALSTVKRQKASDLGIHCARGGTRTAFPPLQTQGTPGNIRNPARFGPHTTRSEARSVDNVHTPNLPAQSISATSGTPRERPSANHDPRNWRPTVPPPDSVVGP